MFVNSVHSQSRPRYRDLPALENRYSLAYGGNGGVNEIFQDYLSILNFRRIARQLDSYPAIHSLIYVFAGLAQEQSGIKYKDPALLASNSYAPYFPDGFDSSAFTSRYVAISQVVEQNGVKGLDGSTIEGDYNDGNHRGERLLTTFFDALGFSVADWFMNRIRGPQNSLDALGFFEGFYLAALDRTHPELNSFIGKVSFDDDLDYFKNEILAANFLLFSPGFEGDQITGTPDSIRWKSIEAVQAALSSDQKTVPLLTPLKGKSFLEMIQYGAEKTYQTCQSCHNGSVDKIPYLPFDRPNRFTDDQIAAIKTRISDQADASEKQRMPALGPYLLSSEQTDFVNYVEDQRNSK